jgi:hypothetical protein
MTLEKLLGSSASELEKLTDAELEEWAKQYWHVTRPAEAKVYAKKNTTKAATASKVRNEKMAKLEARMRELGLDD